MEEVEVHSREILRKSNPPSVVMDMLRYGSHDIILTVAIVEISHGRNMLSVTLKIMDRDFL